MENMAVFCPVLKRQVDGDDCFDISMVAEKTTPDRFLPKGMRPEDFTDDKKEICLKCKISPTMTRLKIFRQMFRQCNLHIYIM